MVECKFKERTSPTRGRFIGIDVGAETVKVVEVVQGCEGLQWVRRHIEEHQKDPRSCLRRVLATFDWDEMDGAAVTGRLARQVKLPAIPVKKAQSEGCRFLLGSEPVSIVSIGGHGFSVQELQPDGNDVYRSNSRCSQGTGNFLRQLCGRFGLSVEDASLLARDVAEPAALSGRCPVILKTDMTHLANKGESQARILAGLFDAVSENVLSLVRPGRGGSNSVVLIGGVSRSKRVRDTFGKALARQGMTLKPNGSDDVLFFEALGAALHAAARPAAPPDIDELFRSPPPVHLDRLPALSDSLAQVRRMTRPGTGTMSSSALTSVPPARSSSRSTRRRNRSCGRAIAGPAASLLRRPRRWFICSLRRHSEGIACLRLAPPAAGAKSSGRS